MIPDVQYHAVSQTVNMPENREQASQPNCIGRFRNRAVYGLNYVYTNHKRPLKLLLCTTVSLAGAFIGMAVYDAYYSEPTEKNSKAPSSVNGLAIGAFAGFVISGLAIPIISICKKYAEERQESKEANEYQLSIIDIMQAKRLYGQLQKYSEKIDDDAISIIRLDNKEDIKYGVMVDKQLYDFLSLYKAIKDVGRLPHTNQPMTIDDLQKNVNNRITKINIKK